MEPSRETRRHAVLSLIAVGLVALPLVAFALLAVLHPLGDPQDSPRAFIRLLDYQGTYWIRAGRAIPPPALAAGFILALVLCRQNASPRALVGAICGGLLLGLWALMMITPLLVHVN